jgi:DNA-directed RNA polymerase alpha subunit
MTDAKPANAGLLETRQGNFELAEIASQHGRMVEIAILRGNRDMAIDIVKEAFRKLDEVDKVTEDTATVVILGNRIATILAGGGVNTVGDLVSHTRDTLVQIHGLRYRSVDLISEALAKHGLKLRRTS